MNKDNIITFIDSELEKNKRNLNVKYSSRDLRSIRNAILQDELHLLQKDSVLYKKYLRLIKEV